MNAARNTTYFSLEPASVGAHFDSSGTLTAMNYANASAASTEIPNHSIFPIAAIVIADTAITKKPNNGRVFVYVFTISAGAARLMVYRHGSPHTKTSLTTSRSQAKNLLPGRSRFSTAPDIYAEEEIEGSENSRRRRLERGLR